MEVVPSHLTENIDEGVEGVEGRAHDEPRQDEGVEVGAERRDDPGDEEDGVGDDKGGVPAQVVRHAAEHEGAHDGAEEGRGLSEGALPRVVAHPIHLNSSFTIHEFIIHVKYMRYLTRVKRGPDYLRQ